MKQAVRIIGGHHRGQNIRFSDAQGLRPTPARIRETLFNWLMHSIRGARCLDAFAGSGALGFEAWSRGAKNVTFIEQSHSAFLNIKKQAHDFDASILQAIQSSALSYLATPSNQFDLIFLDPPFNKPELLEQSIHCIEQTHQLSENGLLYTESSHPIQINPVFWKTLKEKKAGHVYYALHQIQGH